MTKPKERLLPIVMVLVAVHSVIIGAMLLVAPTLVFGLVGWQPQCSTFFLHQVGVFHLVLAFVYAWSYFRHGCVVPAVAAKGCATVFLLLEYAAGTPQLGVIAAGLGDGAMALTIVLAERQVRLRRRRRGPVRDGPTM